MAKKRTKKQKQNPKYPFLVSCDQGSESMPSGEAVKGQNESTPKPGSTKTKSAKNAYFLEKGANPASIRHDIIKSLAVTSFILGLEIVIYLISQR